MKINAFTLSELLVVMVVSSIVLSLAFLVLTMIQKHMILIKDNREVKQRIIEVDRVLWKDFSESSSILKNESEMLVFKSEDTIKYQIEDSFLLRNNDSLLLHGFESEFYLDGEKVKNGFIDAIKLVYDNSDNYLFIRSSKAADFYLNN